MNATVALALGVGSVFALLIAVGQLFLIGQVVTNRSTTGPGPGTVAATSIQCSPVESLATHYHVALLIHSRGSVDVLPPYTGIKSNCLYWLHVHDDSGIVHVEAPAAYKDHSFVLGEVFAVAKLPFDAHHLGSDSYSSRALTVYVNGVKWSGKPGDVPLANLETIDVVAPGESYDYEPFQWPAGFQESPTA
jgi:hypothetical protein